MGCGSRDRGITAKQAKTRLLFISVIPTAPDFPPQDPIDLDRVIGDGRCLGVSAAHQPDLLENPFEVFAVPSD